MANVLTVDQEDRSRLIDKEEKNKFRYDWLSKSINVKVCSSKPDITINVGESIKKVDVSGKALCCLCSDLIYYGKRGYSAITDHLKSKKHVSKESIRSTNYSLPCNFFNQKKSETAKCSTATEVFSKLPVNVPICDRITNAQALVLGTLAENSLSFSMAPVLINLSKTLAKDKKALSQLSMDRTSASYKMRFGLAKTFLEETLTVLRNTSFSLNIDEATSTNSKRVLCLLVSYFSPAMNKIVIEHLVSLNVIKVNAETLYRAIQDFFHEHKIPWENLVSILMDSCAVMRGSKTGLEVRIRQEKAPHLLDIDGDSCHHIHNAVKRFCKPFGGWVEKLYTDLFNDFKWSADIREAFSEVCLILGLKFTEISNMVQHRWLSCYDVTVSNLRIFDALILFYYSFLNGNDRLVFYHIILKVYHKRNVTDEGRLKLKQIWKQFENKNMTEDGKKRKTRIVSKMFENGKKTQLVMNFYVATLPLLKKYVCLFQSKEPLIHKLYDNQKQLFQDFLACFIKPELLQKKTGKHLLEIDVGLQKNSLHKQSMFLGAGTNIIISNSTNVKDPIISEFLDQAKKAYVDCAMHMKKTLPIDSQLLQCISAIDPCARGHSLTLKRLQSLPDLLTNILCSDSREGYELEIHQYQVDNQIAAPVDEKGNLIQIDEWWAKLFQFLNPKYQNLSKIVAAILSCFHGPQVESSFSVMGDVLDKKSGRMNIKTYSSIQTVKYKLRSSNKSAVQYFEKNDFLHDGVDSSLVQNIRKSKKLYSEEMEIERRNLQDKKTKLLSASVASTSFENKTTSKKIIENNEVKAMLAHRKRKLEILSKQLQKKKKKL